MELIYNGLKGGKKLKSALIYTIVLALSLFAAVMLKDRMFENLYLYLIIVLFALICAVSAYTSFFWNVKYKISDGALTITRPISHRKIFPYSNIISIRSASAGEIRQILKGRWEAIHKNDIVSKQLSTPFGNVNTRYEQATTNEESMEEMKLDEMMAYSSLFLILDQSRHSKCSPWALNLNVPESTYILMTFEDKEEHFGICFGQIIYILSPEKPNEFLSELNKSITASHGMPKS